MSGKKEIIEKLDLVRTEMMDLAKEAADRRHEPSDTANHHLRIFVHLERIENSIRLLSWAMMRIIDPHS